MHARVQSREGPLEARDELLGAVVNAVQVFLRKRSITEQARVEAVGTSGLQAGHSGGARACEPWGGLRSGDGAHSQNTPTRQPGYSRASAAKALKTKANFWSCSPCGSGLREWESNAEKYDQWSAEARDAGGEGCRLEARARTGSCRAKGTR